MKTFERNLTEALEIIGDRGILKMEQNELTPEEKRAFARLVVLARRLLAALSTL